MSLESRLRKLEATKGLKPSGPAPREYTTEELRALPYRKLWRVYVEALHYPPVTEAEGRAIYRDAQELRDLPYDELMRLYRREVLGEQEG